MKKNTTYIDACHFEKLIVASGLEVKAQAGFVQVKAPNGARVYVARTKRVGRVDLSAFLYDGPGVVDLGDDSYGQVKQLLDFSLPEADILQAFSDILEFMQTATVIPVKRGSGKKDDGTVGWTIA